MGRSYTILVADDDPEVRDAIAAMVAAPGHHVLTAGDGYEVVRTLAGRHIDLLITDIRMPGLNGVDLAQQVKVMRPQTHIIYMSGYNANPTGRTFGRILQKPFRTADLIAAIDGEMMGQC